MGLLTLVIALTAGITSVSACRPTHDFKEYSRWIDTNGQLYLDVKAKNYYSLGCLEGIELSSKILGMKYSIQALALSYGIPYDYLIQLASLYEPYIAEEYKEEMNGISDVLGDLNITYDDILLQNCFIDIFYGQLTPQMSGNPLPPLEIGCTAIASKNKDKSITIGQNFDFAAFLHPTLSFVLHQIKGKTTIFSLRMGAMLGLPMGKNGNGVISTVTVIRSMVTGSIGVPSTSRTRFAFENSKTATEFNEYLWGENIPTSFNTIYADRKSNVIGTENIPNLSVIDEIQVGDYLIRSNTYINDEFKPYLLDPLYSIERHEKASELVESSFSDNILSLCELIHILQYNDGTAASITRKDSIDPQEPQTGAFMGCRSRKCNNFGFFGIGNPLDNALGIVPL